MDLSLAVLALAWALLAPSWNHLGCLGYAWLLWLPCASLGAPCSTARHSTRAHTHTHARHTSTYTASVVTCTAPATRCGSPRIAAPPHQRAGRLGAGSINAGPSRNVLRWRAGATRHVPHAWSPLQPHAQCRPCSVLGRGARDLLRPRGGCRTRGVRRSDRPPRDAGWHGWCVRAMWRRRHTRAAADQHALANCTADGHCPGGPHHAGHHDTGTHTHTHNY